MKDRFGRNIDYLRISITDRCNLRCRYCMPQGIKTVSMDEILTYEEIATVAKVAAELGISKIKITGGEPLVRPQCSKLIAELKRTEGIKEVTMTSNGILLGKYLDELLAAGLDAINISIDSLDRERYAYITGKDELDTVLSSLEEALKTPLRIKINAVLQEGVNDNEWQDLAELAKDKKLDVRFIEMMPIGFGLKCPGVSNDVLLTQIKELYPDVENDDSIHGNGPARYVHIPGFKGSIGLISAIHGKFCDSCNRIRMTAKGIIKPCLCYDGTVDLKEILRSSESPERKRAVLKQELEKAIYDKPKQHSFEKIEEITEKNSMIQIGG